MPTHFIYPIYTGILALLTFALVPRKEIRRLSMYAIVFGGVTDVFAILLFSNVLGMVDFINFKYFGAFGIPLFPPIAWTTYFIMFMYFMPKNKPWRYIYPVITASFSTYFGYVLHALGIFNWYYHPILLLLLAFLPWQCGVAWAYLRLEEGKVKSIPKHYFTIPEPVMKKEHERKVSFVKPKKL